MSDFSIIMAYMDKGNTFRRRNLFTVLERCIKLFPDTEIVIAEQGESGISTKISDWHKNVKRIQVDDGETFHKTKLLNAAVSASSSDAVVMVDADCFLGDGCRWTLGEAVDVLREGKYGIVFPYDSVDYLYEPFTRDIIAGKCVNSSMCDHGEPIFRQTGLCVAFLKSTWEAVGGFDEAFYEWGAEDDAFQFKVRRKVGRETRLHGHVYHLYHPSVSTISYRASARYKKNRKMCACIRRMSDDDFDSYVSGQVSMQEMLEKYEKMGRLSTEMVWEYVPGHRLRIDTTLYDLENDPDMSFTRLMDAVRAADGDEGLIFFVNDVLVGLYGVTESQQEEIQRYVESIEVK